LGNKLPKCTLIAQYMTLFEPERRLAPIYM
jgi:hypothetical protein